MHFGLAVERKTRERLDFYTCSRHECQQDSFLSSSSSSSHSVLLSFLPFRFFPFGIVCWLKQKKGRQGFESWKCRRGVWVTWPLGIRKSEAQVTQLERFNSVAWTHKTLGIRGDSVVLVGVPWKFATSKNTKRHLCLWPYSIDPWLPVEDKTEQVQVERMSEPLRLDSVIGFGGGVDDGLIVHHQTNTIVYPLGSTIVVRDVADLKKQEFLHGHTDKVRTPRCKKERWKPPALASNSPTLSHWRALCVCIMCVFMCVAFFLPFKNQTNQSLRVKAGRKREEKVCH